MYFEIKKMFFAIFNNGTASFAELLLHLYNGEKRNIKANYILPLKVTEVTLVYSCEPLEYKSSF